MYATLKYIEDEIKRLERKFCYADFISDLFQIVSRDISGGALELQHRVSHDHHGENAPNRVYYEFRQSFACELAVISAARKIRRKFYHSKH